MTKTRRVQVRLDDDQYRKLAETARRQGTTLAGAARQAIVRYCLEAEVERRKRRALNDLLALEPAPVPDDYADWEAEYSRGR